MDGNEARAVEEDEDVAFDEQQPAMNSNRGNREQEEEDGLVQAAADNGQNNQGGREHDWHIQQRALLAANERNNEGEAGRDLINFNLQNHLLDEASSCSFDSNDLKELETNELCWS